MFTKLEKYISFPIFLISLAVGLLFVYLQEPPSTVIYVYPTPDNVNDIEYKDRANNCFVFNAVEVTCPQDTSKIQSIPIQG